MCLEKLMNLNSMQPNKTKNMYHFHFLVISHPFPIIKNNVCLKISQG